MRLANRRIASAALVLVMGAAAGAAQPATASGSGPTSTYASYEDAVPGVAPAGSEATAIYLGSAGQPLDLDSAGQPVSTDWAEATNVQEAAIGPCTPYSGRDNPHRSSTGVAVSGHGWWDKGDCSNNRANVYNCLYEWYTANTWRQKKCSSKKELAPGGGSSNRTVARRDCANTLYTSWRNHVDVDVIGEWDTAENPMRQAEIYCRVY